MAPGLASHEGGGGGWPGGAGGLPPGPLGGGSLFGDGSYSGNLSQGGDLLQPVAGVLTVTGAATLAPDAVTGACVLTCDSLVLNGAAASLAPLTNSKGLIVYARTGIQLLNGARLHSDSLGRAGNFGSLTPYGLTPASLRRRLNMSALAGYVVRGEGAAGGAGAASTNNSPGLGCTGIAGAAMQAGGGGGGACRANPPGGTSGPGGRGGPCCGGAGGGAVGCVSTMHDGSVANAGGPYGGPGGNGWSDNVTWTVGAGAGDPVGARWPGNGTETPPGGAGGGLVMLFAPCVSIASGCTVSADGARGGSVTGTGGLALGGGGAGGGIVLIVTRAGGYSNLGTVRAAGGPGGVFETWPGDGGPGGPGSVNILTAA